MGLRGDTVRSIVRTGVMSLVVLAMAMIAWQTPRASAASAAEIDVSVQDALRAFLAEIGGARELLSRSAAVLVFPTVIKAGMGLGGEYGEGALLSKGKTLGYYNTISASIGFQLGAQARTVIIVFMTPEALASFQKINGWKVGVDGSVTLVTLGTGGAIDSNQITSPIVGFIFDGKGLMYNLTLEGSKISQISR